MLGDLMTRLRHKPLSWVGVCMDPDLSDAEVRTHASDFKLTFRIAATAAARSPEDRRDQDP